MSFAVKSLVKSHVKFAVRGGGHMPIAGSNNIDSSGILLASSGLSQLQISDDQSTVAVGPGNRWGAVYRYLEPYGVTVVGGRLGVVGVPGLLLGGGISFFGNEYGWASANIASFEVSLSSLKGRTHADITPGCTCRRQHRHRHARQQILGPLLGTSWRRQQLRHRHQLLPQDHRQRGCHRWSSSMGHGRA